MISLTSVDFSYDKKQRLIDNLSLTLDRGTIYGLLGKNGTGKSTLLKLIAGSRFPQEGSVVVDNIKSKERDFSILSNSFFLPEDFKLPNCSIKSYESVNGVFYPKYDQDAFYSLLDKFEVDPEKRCKDLSFGQAKKVGIAFALATNVDLLILDEPTNGLDIPSKSQLREALLRGFSDDQIVIISTHQVRDLNQLIESVIILDHGQIIFHQPTHQIEESILFEQSLSPSQSPDVLYSEMGLGGYINLKQNTNKQPRPVDLEILFNGVVSNPSRINNLFK